MMVAMGKLCGAFGCSKIVAARGLCETHYKRLKRHGHLEQTRATDWGEREKHPLYGYWSQIRRNRTASLGGWYDDFWLFVREVGERPASHYLLVRHDGSKPYSAENVFWAESKGGPPADDAHRGSRRHRKNYMRLWHKRRRDADPFFTAEHSLKRFHGMSLDQYQTVSDSQGGTCAICGRQEVRVDRKSQVPYRLAVDHCHRSGELRGLLCSMCNHAIGNFDDDPALLRRAIDYLGAPPARGLGIERSGPTKKRIRQRERSPYASDTMGEG